VNAPRAWRDLEWLLNSPSLLLNSELAAQSIRRPEPDLTSNAEVQAWLQALRAQPAPLLQFVARHHSAAKPLRLGRYAERLLEFYLRHGPAHRLVVANIPLRRAPDAPRTDHTTVGEIDFLLLDAAGQPWHWELAVKYFLCRASALTATPDDFIGPDAVETLRSKLQKLERQLRHTPPAPWDATPWQRAAFSRGWMFYRLGNPVPTCAVLHPQHLKGWWLPVGELSQLPHPRFALLGRQNWMSAFDPAQDTALAQGSASEIALHLHALWAQPTPTHYKKPGAQMLVGLHQTAGLWHEAARYFICPEG
jgi:uncharacterized protein